MENNMKGPERNRIKVDCANCGKQLERVPYDIKRSKYLYCDKHCMIEHRRKIGYYKNPTTYVKVECAECGDEFEITLSKYNGSIKRNPECNFFCSQKCNNQWRSVNQRGENAFNWRGGITKITKHVRACPTYNEWRDDVYRRDNWTCQECGYKGRDIEAHHKMNFIDIIREYGIDNIEDALKCEELWDIENGITLCKDCHKKEHRKLKVA